FEEMASAKAVPRRKVGSQGLDVSAVGLGCMGMPWSLGHPKPEPEMIKLIHHAVDSGVTFFDTSDVYGPHTNEILIGKALKGVMREKVQVATKFGARVENGKPVVQGDPAYVRACCEGSLKRLEIDCIDLYYVHRIDTTVPIEVTVGELKKLVEEGKIKYIGLSEASPDTIRRAHAVHPITAVQLEWSLWTRDSVEEVIPTCRELGIGIVPYSPLGQGFFAVGPKVAESMTENDFRRTVPKFQGENFERNKTAYERVKELAEKKGCTPSQLALAWVLHQGDDVVPIPGTTKIENFNENVGAVSVSLTPQEMAELETIASRIKEMASAKKAVPRRKLGSQGLDVSALGLGCMGMSWAIGHPKPEPEMIKLLHHAVHSGVTFFDTSDVYGPHTNEILIGKALKGVMRENVQVATKFGTRVEDGKPVVQGDPAYVRACCEASLKRLEIDCIDLYYVHRIDTTVPIEVTVGELKKLVEEGKIKYIGLSEASPDTIRRAHAVHPITAVQLEWSLWTRDSEEEVIPTCRELGIGIVPYSPLGQGFFAVGPKVAESVTENDFRRHVPKFQGENFERNKTAYERVKEMAEKKGCTPSQLALAWVLHQGNDVVPIPGTTKIENFNENVGAGSVSLTPQEMAELETIASLIKGDRYPEAHMKLSWKYANTPPLSSWKSS
ncbi:hypothetical protein RJ640_026811, partial [Escallonia rubra]